MTKQSQHELFAQRPVRSDFARSRGGGGLNLRKLMIVCLVLFAAIGTGFALNSFNDNDTTPDSIPTIHADSPVKLRPEEPGGIDIPHQDVTVFQKLDNTSSSKPQKSGVEHLLPEPETPQTVEDTLTVVKPAENPVTTPPAEEQSQHKGEDLPPAITEASPVTDSPIANVVEPSPQPVTAPVVKKAPEKKEAVKTTPEKTTEKDKVIDDKTAAALSIAKNLEKPVKPKVVEPAATPQTVTAGRLPKELFTADTFSPEKTVDAAAASSEKAHVPAAPSVPSAVVGKKVMIQLASYPSETLAQGELKKIQNKYAAVLDGATLKVVRAEVSGKGTYYRIMGSPSSEAKAKAICSDIAKQKGNCLIVK